MMNVEFTLKWRFFFFFGGGHHLTSIFLQGLYLLYRDLHLSGRSLRSLYSWEPSRGHWQHYPERVPSKSCSATMASSKFLFYSVSILNRSFSSTWKVSVSFRYVLQFRSRPWKKKPEETPRKKIRITFVVVVVVVVVSFCFCRLLHSTNWSVLFSLRLVIRKQSAVAAVAKFCCRLEMQILVIICWEVKRALFFSIPSRAWALRVKPERAASFSYFDIKPKSSLPTKKLRFSQKDHLTITPRLKYSKLSFCHVKMVFYLFT